MDAGRVVRAGLRTLLALASVTTLAAAGLAWTMQHRIEAATVTSDAIPDAAPTVEGEAFTALLIGLDARTDAAGNPLPPALLDALHAGPDEGQLHTDTIILLHVPSGPDPKAVAISIPRDSFVPIAGDHGTHKINSAYRRGLEDAEKALAGQGISGPELDRRGREAGRRTLIATVQNLSGVGIDHLAEINLAGFVELTEALGGIPVCLNRPATDSYSGLDLPAGPQTVSGAGALAFVRQRHGLEDGDLDRIARQQAFIAGLAQRLSDTGAMADPARLDQLGGVLTRNVVLDRGWDLDQALSQFSRLAGNQLTFQTIPTGRPDLRTPVDGVAVEIDEAAVRQFVGSVLAEANTPATTAPVPTPTATAPPTAPIGPAAGEPVVVQPAGVGQTSSPPSAVADGTGDIPCVD